MSEARRWTISQNIVTLKRVVVPGADMSEVEGAVASSAALNLLEGLLHDVNRIADALDTYNEAAAKQLQKIEAVAAQLEIDRTGLQS